MQKIEPQEQEHSEDDISVIQPWKEPYYITTSEIQDDICSKFVFTM